LTVLQSPPFGRDRHASFLGDRDEIAKVPQLHECHASEVWQPAYKVFLDEARES